MKNLLYTALMSAALISCQSPKEAPAQMADEPTVIGYEYNEEGEKLNLIVGDLANAEVYLDYIQAHNDKNLDKIFDMNMEDFVIKATDGRVLHGRDNHKEALSAWFAASNPTWKVNWMVANTVQGRDGKNQSWMTTGVDVTETIDGISVLRHDVLDVNFVDGKVKELNVYTRKSEQK